MRAGVGFGGNGVRFVCLMIIAAQGIRSGSSYSTFGGPKGTKMSLRVFRPESTSEYGILIKTVV